MRIVFVRRTFFIQDDLFYTFKDKTNMSTTILRLNGYLFEGSVSNSHLINLLSRACFEHLVCFVRAPAWRDFTVFLGHFSSKSHSSSEMSTQTSWTERPVIVWFQPEPNFSVLILTENDFRDPSFNSCSPDPHTIIWCGCHCIVHMGDPATSWVWASAPGAQIPFLYKPSLVYLEMCLDIDKDFQFEWWEQKPLSKLLGWQG